ncbi:hypothetical protein [Streptomyces tauricus]|nr:hypothetical protein [Streptomyces tauricus]
MNEQPRRPMSRRTKVIWYGICLAVTGLGLLLVVLDAAGRC